MKCSFDHFCFRNNREYRPGSQQGLTLTESVSTYFYYKSSSGSSVEADGNGDSVVAEVYRMQHRMAGPALLPSQRRSEGIPTLRLSIIQWLRAGPEI
jgi:hypothetical protein